jgi:hypothetical protein
MKNEGEAAVRGPAFARATVRQADAPCLYLLCAFASKHSRKDLKIRKPTQTYAKLCKPPGGGMGRFRFFKTF